MAGAGRQAREGAGVRQGMAGGATWVVLRGWRIALGGLGARPATDALPDIVLALGGVGKQSAAK